MQGVYIYIVPVLAIATEAGWFVRHSTLSRNCTVCIYGTMNINISIMNMIIHSLLGLTHVGYGTYVNNVASRGRFLTFVFSLLSPRVKTRTS